MRDDRVKQALKLKLLALVLALALTWYTLNPAPAPVRARTRRGDDEPDAKRREAKSPARSGPSHAGSGASRITNAPPDDPEELDWPEYISLD